ncbi:MAG: TrmH family RNA methyltransferase [Spirochaetales bacterium]|jgi:TrmH family RNA methyltransferase|nr:TrmH family RNA methyltransferase [Spirochaetales bacterium]
MITIRKLASLPQKLLLKKTAYLLHEFSCITGAGHAVDIDYLIRLCEMDELNKSVNPQLSAKLAAVKAVCTSGDTDRLEFFLDDLYYALLGELGASPADWDFMERGKGETALRAENRILLPFQVYLDRVRSPFNVGSLFRTADSFGVSSILLGEGTASPEHQRAKRTSRGCDRTVSWQYSSLDGLLSEPSEPVFALELGGTPIEEYPFPVRGTVIIGSEELGISPEAAEIARSSYGCVTIPLSGTKGSLNLSVAFGILMQHWFASAVKRGSAL